jgi:type I restriction enzyme R subunit
LRRAIATQLHSEVAAMNLDNFIVRPQRQRVETYTDPKAWDALQPEQFEELTTSIAGLPTELPAENEEAKRFDLLMLRLQLARLNADRSFGALSQTVRAIASALGEKDSIPMVREQMQLIQEIQTDLWWQDVTVPMLERVRRRLRSLIRLIEKAERKPVYTDFTDELGDETIVEMEVFSNSGDDFERFREKARHFLRDQENHITIHKLRFNEPLTPTDLSELERMLLESGVGTQEHLQRAKEESQGLGLFIRSLVGLDQEAAKKAFGEFLAGTTASANQIEFINLIIDRLTQQGRIEVGDLYDSPFIDINSQGPEGIFNPAQIDALVSVLDRIRATAAA